MMFTHKPRLKSAIFCLSLAIATQLAGPFGTYASPAPVILEKFDVAQSLDGQIDFNQNAKPFLKGIIDKLKRIDDYVVDTELTTWQGNKGVAKVQGGKYFFKKQQRVRLEVVSKGPKNGSVLVKNEDGQVKAKGGPALLGITVNLHEDSDLLNLADGSNVLHSDFLTQMERISRDLSKGQQAIVTAEPSTYKDHKVWVLEVKEGEAPLSENTLHARVLLNSSSGIPESIIRFKDGKIFSKIVVRNAQLNAGLADALFNL
jgi:outer membrane lipoprotein-sorting protein